MAKDPKFKGSMAEALGLTEDLCPTCHAHLAQNGLCLNACQLSPESRAKLAQGLKMATEALDKNLTLSYNKK